MKGSFKIGNVFGIPVRVHVTFLLLIYAVILFTDEPLEGLGLMLVVFGCVLLHELGHSLVARGFGLRVADITLWPLGGMARMSEIPENSRIEALIAIAGPAVNFALAGLGLIALGTSAAFGLDKGSHGEKFLWFFLVANLLQGGFNLLPAFPMDGGRLLRALLGRKNDWLTATEKAVKVGRTIALLLFLGSLAFLVRNPQSFCLMPLIAVFIWFEGTRELWSVRLRHGVSPLGAAVRFGWSGPAAAGQYETAPGPTPPASHDTPSHDPTAPGEARRPRTWMRPPAGEGFSEAEIRWLEAHPGPVRRPPPDES